MIGQQRTRCLLSHLLKDRVSNSKDHSSHHRVFDLRKIGLLPTWNSFDAATPHNTIVADPSMLCTGRGQQIQVAISSCSIIKVPSSRGVQPLWNDVEWGKLCQKQKTTKTKDPTNGLLFKLVGHI